MYCTLRQVVELSGYQKEAAVVEERFREALARGDAVEREATLRYEALEARYGGLQDRFELLDREAAARAEVFNATRAEAEAATVREAQTVVCNTCTNAMHACIHACMPVHTYVHTHTHAPTHI